MAKYFIRSGKNWEFMEISEEEARKQQFVVWLEDMPGEFWAVRGYYREEAEKMIYTVYSADGVPYYRTSDEAEADYVSFCVGGYYA